MTIPPFTRKVNDNRELNQFIKSPMWNDLFHNEDAELLNLNSLHLQLPEFLLLSCSKHYNMYLIKTVREFFTNVCFQSKLNASLASDAIIYGDSFVVFFFLCCALWATFPGNNNLVVGEDANLCDNWSNRDTWVAYSRDTTEVDHVNLSLKSKVKGEYIVWFLFNDKKPVEITLTSEGSSKT